MSIRDDAYALCKIAFRAPLKQALRELVMELNRSSVTSSGNEVGTDAQNRSLFGYLARGNRAQLLSFLLLAMRSGQPLSDRVPMIIPSLLDEERELLARAHVQILRLNRECLAPLLSLLPHYTDAANPYGHLANVPLPDVAGEDLLSSDAIADMARSFHSHPAFSVALGSNPLSPQHLEQFGLAQAVWQLVETINKAGTTYEPKDVNDIIAKRPENSPSRIGLRHLAAIACLRQSLAMLDQLIFQALLSEKMKLPILDEENIIDPGQWITTDVSKGNTVIYQRDDRSPHGINDYLILYIWPHGYEPIKELCHIENLRYEFSGEVGTKAFIALRTVDENLNPFGQLLRSA
jgi:hypothetical protein